MKKTTINLYENKNKLLNAAVDKITVEIINRKEKQDTQVIAITGVSPLVGTTSTSISLSIAMAATMRKTVLVDCDMRKAGVYKKLNDQVELGLADYVSAKRDNQISLDDIVYPTNFSDLFYIPCGITEENATRILCSERLADLIIELKDNYDCVILDCPSINVVPDAQIMFKKVDGIIYVAALGETKRSHIKDSRRIIEPYLEKYYGMIINMIPTKLYKKKVKNPDYYLTDESGKQRFETTKSYKMSKETKENKKAGAKNE